MIFGQDRPKASIAFARFDISLLTLMNFTVELQNWLMYISYSVMTKVLNIYLFRGFFELFPDCGHISTKQTE